MPWLLYSVDKGVLAAKKLGLETSSKSMRVWAFIVQPVKIRKKAVRRAYLPCVTYLRMVLFVLFKNVRIIFFINTVTLV